ncbi:uncharacterized protein LOC125583021 [Brassica napus]|uniref:uncharacterized protein LOC125583021 n=1 Tax=Brassica napus TaxID=3708 RepID=UPI002078CFC4|nr:uncharacterized protein LOC125583021 [Brassica napus]
MTTSVVLKSRGLGRRIIQGDYATRSEKLRAITIMRHHLTEDLRNQYLNIENPRDLWTKLKSRYTMVLLPKVRHEWMSLRFQDFESVDEYHFALSKIVYKLTLCGEVVTEEDLLEKTFLTADPRDLLLQHIYREKGFTTYNDMLSCLLLTEQSNQLLKRNSEMRYPEANKTDMDQDESKAAVSNVTDGVAGMSID